MPAGRKPREFSPRQLRWVKDNWGKESPTEMAHEMGIGLDTLRRLAKKLGLGPKPRYNQALIAQFYSTSGLSLSEVALHFGCGKITALRACRATGTRLRKRGRPRGEDGNIDSQ